MVGQAGATPPLLPAAQLRVPLRHGARRAAVHHPAARPHHPAQPAPDAFGGEDEQVSVVSVQVTRPRAAMPPIAFSIRQPQPRSTAACILVTNKKVDPLAQRAWGEDKNTFSVFFNCCKFLLHHFPGCCIYMFFDLENPAQEILHILLHFGPDFPSMPYFM